MNHSLNDYSTMLLTKRKQREEQLLIDRGWLTVAGLFWLHEGENSIGSDPDNTVVLAGDHIPPWAGHIVVDHGQIRLRTAPDVKVEHNGALRSDLLMQHDMTDQADYVTLGNYTLLILKRGTRYGVRLFDAANPARQNFPGLRWHPIDPALCINAHYEPHAPTETLTIDNVLGDSYTVNNPGAVYFTVDGHDCCLEAEGRGDKLFFNFRDLTNGDTTYPAGRFLYTDVPVNGKVTLDFNQATNPYCAYTPFATCPLPPPQNRLPVRIEAGEMRYPGQTW
jgi:uncharacterized protein